MRPFINDIDSIEAFSGSFGCLQSPISHRNVFPFNFILKDDAQDIAVKRSSPSSSSSPPAMNAKEGNLFVLYDAISIVAADPASGMELL